MRQFITVCPRDCYDTCSLLVRVNDAGRVVSVRGDPDHPTTRGLTCPRAAADHLRLYANRVVAPAIRVLDKAPAGAREASDPSAGFATESWDEALDLVARRLRETIDTHGPEAVLYLSYSGNTGLLTLEVPQRLWYALGATQTDGALCSKSGSLGLTMHYGARYGLRPEQLADAGLIVFWGFNASVSSMHLWALARQARRDRGTPIVVVDARRSETADSADLWIQPRPGSDVALAYGLIHQLFEMGAADLPFLNRWALGVDALRAEASRWTRPRVEQVAGVTQRQLTRLAEAYSSHSPSATMIGIGLQKCNGGADQVRAVSFIPTVLGEHRGFYYSNGDSCSIDHGLLSGQSLAEKSSSVVSQVALAELLNDGRFKFVYICGMNPAATLTNAGTFASSLRRRDTFVVVHETHWTATTALADVVLPAPSYLEKEDLVVPWSHNHLQVSPQVVAPVGDSRGELWAMRELARRLGLTSSWLYDDPWEAVRVALTGALEPDCWESLRSGQRQRLRDRPPDVYPTPSGKIEFDSGLARQMGAEPLPVQRTLQEPESGWFTLLSSATRKYTHTQFQEVHGAIPAVVQIHPADASRLGLSQGDETVLLNDVGQAVVSVSISEAVPEGVLWSPRQWSGQNSLMSSLPQETGGGPRFNSTRVQVIPRRQVNT
jgi:anaerobic selenocysteine-containing dehydrogenase